jgi:hypothetical protein
VTFGSDSNLSRIKSGAFYGCSSLSSIWLPATLLEIGTGAFDFTNLGDISIEEGNSSVRMRDHFLVNFEGTSIIKYCGQVEAVIIPGDVEELGCHCFLSSKIVSSVTFESGCKLSCIDSRAFVGCSSVSSICIPSSVGVLCEKCFKVCKALSSVTFESDSKLLRIEPEAFYGCSSLSSIFIPPSVEVLGGGCFFKCGALSSVTLEPGCKLSSIPEACWVMHEEDWDLLDDSEDLI